MKHPEDDLQIACVKWFKLQHKDKMIMAIPNGGYRKPREAERLKRMGVRAGVADLFISEPIGFFKETGKYIARFGLWVELKIKPNKQSEKQVIFEKEIIERGYVYKLCFDLNDFMSVVNNYFKGII